MPRVLPHTWSGSIQRHDNFSLTLRRSIFRISAQLTFLLHAVHGIAHADDLECAIVAQQGADAEPDDDAEYTVQDLLPLCHADHSHSSSASSPTGVSWGRCLVDRPRAMEGQKQRERELFSASFLFDCNR